MYRTIILNTANEGSIALYPCGADSYYKETYRQRNARGELRNSKRVQLPANRDGTVYHTVDELFHHLVTNCRYQFLVS